MPFREVNIPYSEQSNINLVQFFPKDSVRKGVVLYFHGNRQNIERYAPRVPMITKQGYEVWMIDYPGYGKSTGEFSEKMLYEWALIFYKLARANYSKDSIIIYGRSLGTGIAAQLASVRDCKALVLEAPYYSFTALARSYFPVYPVSTMIQFKIPTYEYLQNVTAPIIIFHGTDDGVISYSQAKRLEPFLKKGDRFISIEGGGHNDLDKFDAFHQKTDSIFAQ
jgi:pimeloyl-ACP methyl ester carboxylesterase